MAEQRTRTGLHAAGFAALLLLLLLALPAATVAGAVHPPTTDAVAIADAPPGEDCVDDPDAHPGVGLQKCPEPFNVGSLLPFVGGGVVVLLAIVLGWFLVMRRRVSRPFLPDEALAAGEGGVEGGGGALGSADWWTCRSCGATNMVGSARCYKCGSWQR